ncbi:MAG: DUF1775 domain-containing protein [Acidobacteria bacterium]|nr:DUF1775 domain-containing protein [Acidobacteriota bacterium]
MTRVIACAVSAFLVASAAAEAHVSVRPRESKAGATEKYTVRVPTEGKVATTSVEVEIPQGVMVNSVEPAEGVRFEVKREGGRFSSITWTVTIDPGQNRELAFVAKNPTDATEIVWKAHQRYADGTSSEWIGAVGTRQPAAVTRLTAAAAGAPESSASMQAAGDESGIAAWLQSFDRAFVAKDLDRLALFYHPDVTIFEGGGVNNGWADYRDHHIGPELKGFENLQPDEQSRE